jgi:tetratricopeptide (TPR) repeat protein
MRGTGAAITPVTQRSKAEAKARRAAASRLWAEGKSDEALVAFGEAVRIDPNDPDGHFHLGVAHFRLGHLSYAVECLVTASRLRPHFRDAVALLATILENLGRKSDACSAFRKLSHMTEGVLERRYFSAKALILEGKLDEAEKELRRVIAAAPDHSRAQAHFGLLLSMRGKFEEALPHLMSAIDTFPEVFQSLVDWKRLTEDDRPLVDRMLRVAEHADLTPMQKASIRFGLGKAFNDLGDYGEAMRHYDEGNRLKAVSNRINRVAISGFYESVMSDFSREVIERLRPLFAGPPKPEDELPVLIIGMMRSGSTLVEQILSSHPAVAAGDELPFWRDRAREWQAAPPSETGPVFTRSLDWMAQSSLIKGSGPLLDRLPNNWVPTRYTRFEAGQVSRAAEDYLALLRKIGPKALRVTDKELSNFEHLGAIHLALPKARIIHCRRHPVDTCLSIYFANIKRRNAWDRSELVFLYRQYEQMMEHWRGMLPPERFTEVQYETLIADREAESRRLITFLGLEWDDVCLAPERNMRTVTTSSLWQVRQPVYKTSVERWRRYEPWLGELRELLKDEPIPEKTGSMSFPTW